MSQLPMPETALALLDQKGKVGLVGDPFQVPPGCVLEEVSVPSLRPTVWDGKRSTLLDHPTYPEGSVWTLADGRRVQVLRSQVTELRDDDGLHWVTYIGWAPANACAPQPAALSSPA